MAIVKLLTTAEFAARNLVQPASVRERLSRRGDYFGVVPVTLLNGRLGWPDSVVVPPEGRVPEWAVVSDKAEATQ